MGVKVLSIPSTSNPSRKYLPFQAVLQSQRIDTEKSRVAGPTHYRNSGSQFPFKSGKLAKPN